VPFELGNFACVRGAIKAGCNFFAGYPITPASEIAHLMATEIVKNGGIFIQMEDELASIGCAIGAVWSGAKAMTATSGPGFSLMQENLGYAYITETPLVIVNVQRSGPSTGQATMPGQQDVYQARYGSHGDYEAIVLSPWSVQEMYDLTIKAFNLSEEYRMPIIVLTDGEIAHIREKYELKDFPITPRKFTKTKRAIFGPELVPPMSKFGIGHKLLITGSAHNEEGIRDYTPTVHRSTIVRICEKVRKNADKISSLYYEGVANAKKLIISFGASARPSYGAFLKLRKKKFGFIRLITLWPLPEKSLIKICENKEIYVVEMNYGQISREMERIVKGKVRKLSFLGGVVPSMNQIIKGVQNENNK
jgi:2-oxoglutarate ferredoxin oxidoreductase subunit alpha